MFFCYKITNLLDGKVYIGKTNRPHERWIEHRTRDKNYPLSNAIKKYGASNFSFVIIAISEMESAINKAESLYIKQYRSNIHKYGKSFGYNLTDGGEGISGWNHSPEIRQKMSNSHKGIPLSTDHRQKISNNRKGIKHTEKYKNSIRGENHPRAKLTWDIVNNIRERYETTNISAKQLADKYGVSMKNIQSIIYRKSWNHAKI
jgi:group I intron endonuclease